MTKHKLSPRRELKAKQAAKEGMTDDSEREPASDSLATTGKFLVDWSHERPGEERAAATIVVLFNLKPDVTEEEYETWARLIDQPAVNALPSVKRMQVLKTEGVLGVAAAPPMRYIEIVEVGDVERFHADISEHAASQMVARFEGFAHEPIFIVARELGARR
jgi:hypothetical protein